MNLNLKAVYVTVSAAQRWGKGLTIAAAHKAAGIDKVTKNSVAFYTQAAMFQDPTKEALDKLLACISANTIDGSPCYYSDGRTQEDTDLINQYHVGWVIVERHKVSVESV